MIRSEDLDKTLNRIRSGKLKSWEDVHALYRLEAENYPVHKLSHALAALKKLTGITITKRNTEALKDVLQRSVVTRQTFVDNIYRSREKDYTNPFRKMVYGNDDEMNNVVGALADNPFIMQERENLKRFKRKVAGAMKSLDI